MRWSATIERAVKSVPGQLWDWSSTRSLSGTMSRRDFLKVGAGLTATSLTGPALVDELTALLEEKEGHVEPEMGESLDPDSLLRWEQSKPKAPPVSERHLFLTFDDGPLYCTGRILDLLAATTHKATFFVIGRNLANPKLRDFAVRALKEGHDIGNHSYTHPDFSRISSKRAEREIVTTHKMIQELVLEAGVDAKRQDRFFRFPYGVGGSWLNYQSTQDVLGALDYRIAGWDVDTNDWRMEVGYFPRPSKKVIASVAKAKPRDVVLLHDRAKTALHLPEIIKALEGHQLVSLPLSQYGFEFVARHNPENQPRVPAAESDDESAKSQQVLGEFLKALPPDTARAGRAPQADTVPFLEPGSHFW